MTHQTCRMYPKDSEIGKAANLPETTYIPVINRNAIAKINRRDYKDEEWKMTAEEFDKLFRGSKEDYDSSEKNSRIRMSADVVAQLQCKNRSTTGEMFCVTRDHDQSTKLQIKCNSQLAQSEFTKARREIAKKIGILAEKEIADNTGEGVCVIQSRIRSPDGPNWQYCERETDAIGRNGRDVKEATEIKCVGQLKMSKEYFYNQRLYPMVAKCIASKSLATYIVQRDDREMDLNNDSLHLTAVQYCEDITRLLPKEEVDEMVQTHKDIGKALYRNIKNVGKIEVVQSNKETNIKISYKNGKPYEVARRANIPCSIPKANNEKKINIIVGPNIPYFDFRNSDYYITYKYKFKDWGIPFHHKKIFIIAESFEDIKLIFEKYKSNRNTRDAEIVLFTGNSLQLQEKKYLERLFHNKKENFTYEVFRGYNNLGDFLYNHNLTYWKNPIPQLLILLSKGMYIPRRLITAKCSSGNLYCNSKGEKEEYETGLHFPTCPEPQFVIVIGSSLKECKGGILLVEKYGWDDRIRVYCPTVESTDEQYDKRRITVCAPAELEDRMKDDGLPMYKTFLFKKDSHKNGFWKAS